MKILDWIAAVLCIIGVLLIAYRVVWGFHIGTASNVMYVFVARRAGLNGLLMVEVVLIGCNLLGIYKWTTGG